MWRRALPSRWIAKRSATLLILPNGDSALFPCPLQGGGRLSRVENLPEQPSAEIRTLSSIEIGLTRDDSPLDLTVAPLVLQFAVPEGTNPDSLVVLWRNGSEWMDAER